MGPAAHDKWARELREVRPDLDANDIDLSVGLLLASDPTSYKLRGFTPPPGGARQLVQMTGAAASLADQFDNKDCPTLPNNPSSVSYYNFGAAHHRQRTNESPERSMSAGFHDSLPVARVDLPLRLGSGSPDHFDTNIGAIDLSPSLHSQGFKHGQTILHHAPKPFMKPNGQVSDPCMTDHFYGSVEELRDDWKDQWADTPGLADLAEHVDRVEIITMARIRQHRFAAIGIYLVYRNDDHKKPVGYVIEAGTADSEARQVFWANGLRGPLDCEVPKGTGMGVAGGRSTYDPTFLSNPQNQYKSWLCGDMKNDRWEPGTLLIAAYHPDKNVETDEPYLTVKAKLSPKDDSVVERCITPTSGVGANEWAIHFCEAGGRVAEIDAVAGGAEPDQTKHFGLLRKLCALRRGTLVYFDGGPDPSAPHAPMPRKEWPVDACK